MTPRLVSLQQATAFLGGKHPSRFGAKPVCSGRDSVWDLVELNVLLNQRLDELGLIPPRGAADGAANDTGQDELKALWDKIHAPAGSL